MSAGLIVRPASECRYDVLALGEVMLRFDPGEGRVRNTRSFTVSEGGGEYNVGRALRRTFGRSVAIVTAIGDNDLGRLLEDLLLQGGVNVEHVVWKDTDPIGRAHRNPLNFTERGFGVRHAVGVYDRAHSATGALTAGDVDWDHLFGTLGVRWFHTGGIFASLSSSTVGVAHEAIVAARRHGVVVSYDLNYRPSLWEDRGGEAAARAATAEMLGGVDVLFGIDADGFESTATDLAERYPTLAVIATPERRVLSASRNDWSGMAWTRNEGVLRGARHEALEILDRVGGGDGFAAGLVHGLIGDASVEDSLELGIALGALTMTTPGDTAMVDEAEVAQLIAGDARGIRR